MTTATLTTVAFLAELRARKINVSADGDRLRCTGPKGSLTPDLQSELLRRKADILSCLQERAASRRQPPPIRPVSRVGPFPLSFGQQRLWFLHQIDPTSAAYNLYLTIPLPAADVTIVERALSEIVRRHATLRTAFTVIDGSPVQVITPAEPVTVPVFDLSGLEAADRVRESQRIQWETFSEPFDLAEGQVIRFALLRHPDAAAELIVAQHHIATDGWSIALFCDELRVLGGAYAKGEEPSLPALSIQYVDYACWQREWLQGDVLADRLAYWRDRLDNLSVLDLPADRPRPAIQSFAGAAQSFVLSATLSNALRRLSHEHDVTLYMTLLAAFQALLARYAGQTDIAVGTSNGNRSQVEIEHLIGFFVNTQVVRTDLGGDPTFVDVLRRVSSAALDAYEHQDVPFEKLVEELQPKRDLSRSPLFDVMFILHNATAAALPHVLLQRGGSSEAIRAGESAVRKAIAKFDLTLSMTEAGDRIGGSLEYSTALFDDDSVTRMLRCFEDLLQVVATDPTRRISSIPLLSGPDRAVLAQSNATTVAIPDACVHDLIAAQARRTPDAIAIASDEETLTYAALDALSNQIARRLIASGVRSGSRVAICVDRTPRMVAAVLAVLKSGAAYVPLDPEYPHDRLAYILADSGAVATLTERAVESLLPAGGGPRILIDSVDRTVDEAEPLPHRATPASVAYLIYTSGSTGRPKGVVVPHRAVVNFLSTMARRPGLAASDVLVAVTTLAFDIAGLELLLPLTVGARVVIADRADTLSGSRLTALLVRSNATVLQATPATWRLLVDAGWDGTPPIRMFCGGEALSRDLADTLLDRAEVLWNLYGPTETTIWSAAERVDASDRPVTIGHPIGNTALHVLDAAGSPVPPGFVGELYVGGAGVTYGYYNQPDLTAGHFVPDPFTTEPGARMYRTGDLAKRRADGRVEYLGRADHQIKLRGFRIELTEIEAVLGEVSGVADAIAVVRGDGGEPRLVAYVRPVGGETVDMVRLLSHLRDQLPAYMVPADIVAVEAWPRTPNGKVDRKALPAPADTIGVHAGYAAPQSDAERRIAEIWRGVLKVDGVGASDNFFDLGGHSLLIVTLQAQLAAAFDRPVRVVDLFRFPTVQALASHLTRIDERSEMVEVNQGRASRNREAARRRRTMRDAAMPPRGAAPADVPLSDFQVPPE